jgi:hypothetical protein
VPRVNGRWKLNKETAADQIVYAVKAGYRLFDGAQDYDNEKVPPPLEGFNNRNVAMVSVARSPKVSLNARNYSS